MINYGLIAIINCKNIMEIKGVQAGKCFVDIIYSRNYCQINPNICKDCGYRVKVII